MLLALNNSLVEGFVKQMKQKAVGILKNQSDRIDAEKLSTVISAWLIYSMGKQAFGKEELAKLLKRDEDRRGIVGDDIFFAPSGRDFAVQEQLCLDGLCIIKSAWPDLFQLITVINPRIVPLQSEMPAIDGDFESASGPTFFGQIFFSMNRQNPMGWAEIIAHEIGHHYLFAIFSAFHKQVQAPWKEFCYSAIRKTERPLIGVFHGVVAESFMIALAYLVIENKSLGPYHEEAEKLFKRQADRFLIDYDTVSRFNILQMEKSVLNLTKWVKDIIDHA